MDASADIVTEKTHLVENHDDSDVGTRRRKVQETCCLYLGYLCLGLNFGIVGPTLLDLEYLTNTSTDAISYIITGTSLSSLIGSLLAGPLVDRCNNWIFLIIALVLKGTSNFWIPWTGNTRTLTVAMILNGLSNGFFDPSGNIILLRIWGSEHGPWMQALHLIFGAGSLLGPLLAEPFLADNNDAAPPHHKESNSSMINNLTHGGATPGERRQSQVWIVYTVAGSMFVISALLCTAIYITRHKSSVSEKTNTAESADSQIADRKRNDAPLHKNTVLVLLYLFVLCFCIVESTFPNYLTIYTVDFLDLGTSTGAFMTSVFWGAYTVARTAGIFTIKLLPTETLLLINCIGVILFSAPIPFLASSYVAVMWTCSAGLGLSVATLFPTAITWTDSHVTITGPIMSIFMVAASSGETIGPLMVGALFDQYGMGAFADIIFVSCCAVFVTFISLHYGSFVTNKLTNAK